MASLKQRIKYHFAAKIKYTYKKELKDAIELAKINSVVGDIVLFSPACASYANYENSLFRKEEITLKVFSGF